MTRLFLECSHNPMGVCTFAYPSFPCWSAEAVYHPEEEYGWERHPSADKDYPVRIVWSSFSHDHPVFVRNWTQWAAEVAASKVTERRIDVSMITWTVFKEWTDNDLPSLQRSPISMKWLWSRWTFDSRFVANDGSRSYFSRPLDLLSVCSSSVIQLVMMNVCSPLKSMMIRDTYSMIYEDDSKSNPRLENDTLPLNADVRTSLWRTNTLNRRTKRT